MAKKTSPRELFLRAFVELRKKNPKKYPRVADLVMKVGVKKNAFYKEFESADAFYAIADEHLKKVLPKQQLGLLTEKGRTFDPNATQDDCIADLREIQEAHPLSFITRTKYRNEGKYSDCTWSHFFGTFKEFRRQAGLELSRHQQGLERHVAKQVANDVYRDYFTTEVLPYCNKYEKNHKPGKIKTLLIGSDIHDVEVDEFTLSVFIDTALKMQPDVIVLNGDIFDLYELSNFGKDLRHVKLKERFDFVKEQIFAPLRKACPRAQIDFIMGNHEFRLLRVIADQTPHLRVLLSDVLGLSFSKIFGLDEFGINWISKLDLGVFSKADIRDQLKKNYKIYFDCYVVSHEPDNGFNMAGTNGHHHKAQLTSFNSPTMGEMTWTQTPGMHVSDAEYLKGMSKWNTGFLITHINTDTKEVVQNIIQTHKWAVVNGCLYERKGQV